MKESQKYIGKWKKPIWQGNIRFQVDDILEKTLLWAIKISLVLKNLGFGGRDEWKGETEGILRVEKWWIRVIKHLPKPIDPITQKDIDNENCGL